MKFHVVKNIIIKTNNAIILYIERTLWRIIDLYVWGGHLGFWKSHAGVERPPGLNFIETLRTIEKSKETIVNGPNKVMGPATGLISQGETKAVRSRPRQRQFFWGRDNPMKYRGSWHEAEASKFFVSRQPRARHLPRALHHESNCRKEWLLKQTIILYLS